MRRRPDSRVLVPRPELTASPQVCSQYGDKASFSRALLELSKLAVKKSVREAVSYRTCFGGPVGVAGRLLSLGFTTAWKLILSTHFLELSKQTGLALRLPQSIDIGVCCALPSLTASCEWFGLMGGVSPRGRG